MNPKALLLISCFLPLVSLANNGLQALGKAYEILFFGIVWLIVSVVSLLYFYNKHLQLKTREYFYGTIFSFVSILSVFACGLYMVVENGRKPLSGNEKFWIFSILILLSLTGLLTFITRDYLSKKTT